MSLRNVRDIKLEYRTLADSVVDDFYIPCLKETRVYKRAVGFFSSSILLQISKGLGAIASKGGKIKLLVSPRLSKDDYEAIERGYELKKVVSDKLEKEFDESIEFEQKLERFTLLSYLISHDILEIEIAIVENESNDTAMYHEKLGIMVDDDDNIVAFSGSANESDHAFNLNYECIDTFCSWSSEDAFERCQNKEFRFDLMWENDEKGLVVIPFPDVIKQKILKYNNYDIDFSKLDNALKKIHKMKREKSRAPTLDNVKLYDYQDEAIANWKAMNYHGIFDMATGTGKTFTGCGAIVNLLNDKKRLVTIICCPYIHLVDQWCEEVKLFNIEPIKCYGGLKYHDKLERQVYKFKNRRTNFVCIIISNSSFIDAKNQELFKMNIDNTLLLADEAHNFGARNLSEMLKVNYAYRLALSATLDRYGDDQGTKKLYNFFGEKCITYDLGRAIIERKLTPYYYYPVLVELDEEELNEYQDLTKKIKKYCFTDKNDEMPDELKMLLIKRARLIAKAKNKIRMFEKIISDYKTDSNIIVYCGAVKYNEHDFDDCKEDKKQIEIIKDSMNNKFNMVATKFTAEEDVVQRQAIINSFKLEEIQALVAIKCLDEGMNIPAIKTAFLLASGTNPKEYIQRRGRVLRRSEGKDFATIYDFITIPRKLEKTKILPRFTKELEAGLVERELIRLIDFANLSMNPSDSNELIDKIKSAYDLNIINEGDINEYE